MAARSHVDASVNERRLRPIYDCLDNGNNKKALQEAEKLLKKQKDFLCAKALKSLALIRLGKQDDAFTTIQEVHFGNPTDDATLQAMTICYRELHKPEFIADAYERATYKEPQNEELLSHLFMSHVRNGDYRKQQQTAMTLYKLKPKNPYYFWTVMSIVMQANVADKNLAEKMLLPLAERMTAKFVKDNKLEAEAEVQLYLMILEQQEKYVEAIEVLEGPLNDKLSPYQDHLKKRKAQFLRKLERWPEVNVAYKKLILGNPDQWSFYLDYFQSVSQLVDSNWQPDDTSSKSLEDTVDHNFESAIDFVAALVDEQNRDKSGRKLRGPYLAQIELLNQLTRRADPITSKIGSFIEVLLKFYETFGTKPSCYVDFVHVLTSAVISKDEMSVILEKIKASLILDVSEEGLALPKDVKQMHRHLCYSLLCQYLGFHENQSRQDKLTYARELIERYHHAQQFGANFLPTEFHPADNYCILAAHTLISLWKKTGDERLIAQVMVLLEQGLKGSPSNFQMKLLLIKLYNAIGAAGASFSLYESIDVKHIQQETLGHLIIEPLLSVAFYATSGQMLGSCIRFFTSNYKDTVDYLMSCYKFGSFTKIPELVNFREKVNNSIQYASVTVERMILSLLQETKCHDDTVKTLTYMEIDPEKDVTIDCLTDNRDIYIFRICSQTDKDIVDEQVVKSFQEKVWWLKIRNLIVRILAASLCISKSSAHLNSTHENSITNGEKRNMVDILSDLVTSISDLILSIDRDNLIDTIFPVQAPGPSRLFKYLQDGHIDVIVLFSKLVLSLHSLLEGSIIEQGSYFLESQGNETESGRIGKSLKKSGGNKNKKAQDSSQQKCDLSVISDIKSHFQDSTKKLKDSVTNKEEFNNPTQMKTLLEDITNILETLCLGTLFVSICHTMLKPARISLRKGRRRKENVPLFTEDTFQDLESLISELEKTCSNLHDLLVTLNVSLLTKFVDAMSLKDNENCLKNKDDTAQQVISKAEKSYLTSIKELKDLLHIKVKYLQTLKW